MKRKVYIFTLLGIFLISTTGLPVTIRFCSMKDMKSAMECKMHMKMTNKCEGSNDDDNSVKIKAIDFDSCCQIRIIDKNITDKYLTSEKDSGTKISVKAPLISELINYQSQLILSTNLYTNNSPPPLSENHLYLTISILLI